MLAYLYFQHPDHDYRSEGGLTPFGSDPADFSPLVPGEQVREVSFWLGRDSDPSFPLLHHCVTYEPGRFVASPFHCWASPHADDYWSWSPQAISESWRLFPVEG